MTNESDIEAMAERKRFEDWHDNLFDVCAGTAVKTEYGYPQNGAIQMRWQAWQAALAAPPVERLRAELEDTQANYSGAMADLDALVDAFYVACPDNYFLNANYPREGSDKVMGELERLRAENARLRNDIKVLIDCIESDNGAVPEWVVHSIKQSLQDKE